MAAYLNTEAKLNGRNNEIIIVYDIKQRSRLRK